MRTINGRKKARTQMLELRATLSHVIEGHVELCGSLERKEQNTKNKRVSETGGKATSKHQHATARQQATTHIAVDDTEPRPTGLPCKVNNRVLNLQHLDGHVLVAEAEELHTSKLCLAPSRRACDLHAQKVASALPMHLALQVGR